MTAAKCRNFKACCESGGTEKRRHALGTTSRHGTLLILPSAAPSNPFGPCRYDAEEPDAFWPRTHASMFFQSGSSWDANCLPPWWVSAMPPASGTNGINIESGAPGTTSFETVSKLRRDCSSVQRVRLRQPLSPEHQFAPRNPWQAHLAVKGRNIAWPAPAHILPEPYL